MLEEAVEDGGGGGHITDQLVPDGVMSLTGSGCNLQHKGLTGEVWG